MAWIRMKGVTGLVYAPEPQAPEQRKHNCADCFYCQWCSDERCAECLKRKKHLCRKRAKRKK